MSGAFFRRLARSAAGRYPARDRFARFFCYFKLTGDPVFRYLIEHGLIPAGARVLDLGAGQGMLEALLTEAATAQPWPAAWAPPPRPTRLRAIDLGAREVERARSAVPHAEFLLADIRDAAFDEADVIVILDVLHYLELAAQDSVLERVRRAIAPGGVLLLRVADASSSLRFRLTEWIDRVSLRLRGGRPSRYHCRPLESWKARLAALGLDVRAIPMSAGTPFANVLLVASPR